MGETRKQTQKKGMSPERKLKTALHYALAFLINVFILYLFVKVFSLAFNFSYDVFADSAKNPGSSDYAVVEILPDSSTSDIAQALYDAEVIDNKYVMIAKIKVGEYGGKIKSGTYGLSSSMTYNEILNIICGTDSDED